MLHWTVLIPSPNEDPDGGEQMTAGAGLQLSSAVGGVHTAYSQGTSISNAAHGGNIRLNGCFPERSQYERKQCSAELKGARVKHLGSVSNTYNAQRMDSSTHLSSTAPWAHIKVQGRHAANAWGNDIPNRDSK